jgi:hypothetical protein
MMNEREKAFFDMMCGLGLAIMNEGRKTNIKQEAIHSIVFSPESGYVWIEMRIGNTIYTTHRFDQFPDMEIEEHEDKTDK